MYTAYEYLGRRFDAKTRFLGAALFLLQRGLQAEASPSTRPRSSTSRPLLHWRAGARSLLTGLVVIAYTAAGGGQAVNVTQKYQLSVIFCGMFAAFVVPAARRMPPGVGLDDALALAGGLRLPQGSAGVDFSVDPSRQYTLWSGLLREKAFFLALVVLRHRPVRAGPAAYLSGNVAPRSQAWA